MYIPSLTSGYFGYSYNGVRKPPVFAAFYSDSVLGSLSEGKDEPGTLKHLPRCKEGYPCSGNDVLEMLQQHCVLLYSSSQHLQENLNLLTNILMAQYVGLEVKDNLHRKAGGV